MSLRTNTTQPTLENLYGSAVGAGDDAEMGDLLTPRRAEDIVEATRPRVHVLKEGIICRTDSRPEPRSRTRIVLDATDGFIPLWAEGLVLRWEFDSASLSIFQKPEAIKKKIRQLFGAAVASWGEAVPIRFDENPDNPDFRIVVEANDDCTPQGCTLAQAFFPDAGRHPLYVFPKMFTQSRKEQVDTLAHEIGHVFGLRHFFAPTDETEWPAVIFGRHKPFSIMNYGNLSELTDTDRHDLHRLYESAWDRKLKKINGTPIKLVRPFHYLHT